MELIVCSVCNKPHDYKLMDGRLDGNRICPQCLDPEFDAVIKLILSRSKKKEKKNEKQ